MADSVTCVGSIPIRITAGEARSVLSLKSWNPAHRDGGWGLTLTDQALPELGHTRVLSSGAPGAKQSRVLCVGPAEWIITSVAASLLAQPALSEPGAVVTDLSHSYVTLELRGLGVRDVLSSACGLDLHPSAFSPGRCARTRFAQVLTVIDCVQPDEFHLLVGRSYGAYLRSWLEDSARGALVR